MGKMLDNVRAWWNSMADGLGDPGKLAQLSVADLERGIRRAKEAAAPVIGRPVALEGKVAELVKSDAELTAKITALIKSGESGRDAARKYIERQVIVRAQLEEARDEFEDARAASDEWQAKIRTLENELYARRHEANRLQADFETAKAEQQLGRTLQSVDSLAGADNFSSIRARVDKEKARAAGYSAMSGLSDKVNDEKLVRDAQTDALMQEYMNKLDSKE